MNPFRVKIDGLTFEVMAPSAFVAAGLAIQMYLETEDANPDATVESVEIIGLTANSSQLEEPEEEWSGANPTNCQACGTKIGGIFIDGRVRAGGWGILCVNCHGKVGVGLGEGRGQLYARLILPPDEPTKWVKIRA